MTSRSVDMVYYDNLKYLVNSRYVTTVSPTNTYQCVSMHGLHACDLSVI